ncbi:FMN-binding protein [Fusobacterium simiae]|uniref:FMN-binding protein n=1 Tax=Fusobacterium TaxID=848 RepID=UPI00042813B5|nr:MULTISPECIES: FMN-binding protein [Fusobacterium]MDC7955933.1 FMN-binding protein [Fusobacterium simiae]
MTLKDLRLREWLVIIFIGLGLLAFAFEDVFKPKIYQAEGTGVGYIDDITLKVSAYKKGEKIRVTEIEVEHADTDEIGGVAIQKLVDDVKARQKFGEIDAIAGATFTSEGFKEALNIAIDDIRNQQ